MAFRMDERRKSNTVERATRFISVSVEKRSARIMSFRRIMSERSRRARQSVSFTCRGRFNYPIDPPLLSRIIIPGLLFPQPRFFFFIFRAIERLRALSSRQERENDSQVRGPDNDEQELALKRNDRAFIAFRVSRDI